MREVFKWAEFQGDFSAAACTKGFFPEVILETADGPVVAWERKGSGPTVYVSAGIHGDEPAGSMAVLELVERDAFPQDFHVLLCPALNPGGLATGSRGNRAGRDLNRDYLLFQSLETAAHSRWLSRQPVPDLFVSMHEDWETSGFYFYEINTGDDDPQRAAGLLAAVSTRMPVEGGTEIDGHGVRGPGWIFHCAEADLPDSWPEAIYLAKLGCPLSFTFETPSQARLVDRVDAHVLGFLAVVDGF